MPQTLTRAKKERGLDDLFKDYTPQQLEEQKNISSLSLSSSFEEAWRCYEQHLYSEYGKPGYYTLRASPLNDEGQPIVLLPQEINLLLRKTMKYDNHPGYAKFTAGFVTRLIEYSFLAGHRDFFINTKSLLPLQGFGRRLVSMKAQDMIKQDPLLQGTFLKVTIDGGVGSLCGFESTMVHYHILGNMGLSPFNNVKSCTAIIEGKIEGQTAFSQSYDSVFFIHEYEGAILFNVQNCIFKTDNEKTFHHLTKNNHGENTIVCLVDSNDKDTILEQEPKRPQ